MTPGSFTTEDKERLVSFVNFVTKNMRVSPDWDTEKCLAYIRQLGWMQKELVAKVEANIMEAIKLHEPLPKPPRKRKG